MELPDAPDGWETDALATFLDRTRRNCFATFHNLRPEWERLSDIHLAFEQASDTCSRTDDPLPAFFLVRAHSAFLASARLVAGAQLPESYACLRLTIEHSLHAHYLTGNVESQLAWLNRNDDEGTRRTAVQEFRPRKLLDHLAQTDAELAAQATALYETSIDMGAHPNERAITTNMRMAHDGGEISFENVLLADHGPALRTTLRTCAQVGVCALEIFQVVYAERFASAGLTAGLCSLRADLP